MIQVIIDQKEERIVSFEMSGHANFDEYGSDIVCAGASAVSFGAVNAIMELTKTEPVIEQADSGFLKVEFPELENEETDAQVQLLVRAMIVSLKTIEQSYQDYMTISFLT